jgi:transmembrane serine protease 2
MAVLFIWFLIQISLNSLESITYSCLSNSACGCSLKPAILTKIVGGEVAKEDTWGWAVSIRLRNTHICGGSLISPSLVLTAAHCFASKSTMSGLSVTAGSQDLSIIRQQRSISKVYIHRNYGNFLGVPMNDIAVLVLSSPFNMKNSPLALICLSTSTTEYNTNDTNVVAIGWGVTVTGGRTPNILRQVTLQTVASNDSTCRPSIRNAEVQLCAGVSGDRKGKNNIKH